ncbi:hypothetical protein FZEAL_9079 [Fusarium zealandicum]|uniref:Endonuclease/exonuclease/phosphatase domain-containing protein n=1 Tax=Fusarium zealandicum TaxID=1053134 RepID=A0A8H4UCN5_9HYPO|nr:hypothetical protein FZEAL_9079 [Fusarium zealandicum]
MWFQSRLVAVASALWIALFSAAQVQGGSLSLVKGQALFTFQYSTQQASSTNWVGLYHFGDGPVDQEKRPGSSITWKYAPGAEGTLQLDPSGLEPGNYTAFFLANGGYKWVSDPAEVYLPREAGGDVSFIVSEITLPNARQGDEYSYSIAGLIKGGETIQFAKQGSSPGWVHISPEGVISGTPPHDAEEAVVTARAIGPNSAATAVFTIPVRPSGSRLLNKLEVLSLNMWNGGTKVSNYHEKQVRFIASSGADVVGLQEDQSGRHAARLAGALGWYYWSSHGDVGILSKYPIVQDYGVISGPSRSGGVRIALDGESQQINFYVAHLGFTPYGPYDFCYEKMTPEQVIAREEQSGRTPQMKATLAGMEKQLDQADKVPLLFAGDMNAPSHLDWTEGLKEKHCGYAGVRWPTSVLPEEAGLVDSFRVAHPDPVAVEGLTWSPLNKWNGDKPEPQDRIDFIYHKGKGLKVSDSRAVVVGKPNPDPYRDNEWTSDHAAVLTSYELDA